MSEREWGICGLVLMGKLKNVENTWRKTCPSATSSTTNLTWTGLGLNSFLCGKTLTNSCWRHGMAVVVLMHLISLITINWDHWDGVLSRVALL